LEGVGCGKLAFVPILYGFRRILFDAFVCVFRRMA
jgi:hypothetical protein